jgi:leader peptidase (prepilin peptidase)/N-methyltransferase
VNALAASGFAVAGAVAGIPVAAIAFAAPARGAIPVRGRWWLGEPARPCTVGTISILTGATAGFVAGCLPLSPALPAFWVFAVLAICLAVIDLRRHRLPHAITGTITVTSIGCFAIAAVVSGSSSSLVRALGSGSIAAVALLIIALSFPGQLGLGDVALGGAVALNLGWLSWQAVVVGMAGAFLLQGTVALTIRARYGGTRLTPMGPALTAGWIIGVLSAAV